MADPELTHAEAVPPGPPDDWRRVRQMGHDLNNMLGVIGGFAEMLIEDLPPGSPLAPDLHQIHETAGRATAVVHALMELARRPQAASAAPTLPGNDPSCAPAGTGGGTATADPGLLEPER